MGIWQGAAHTPGAETGRLEPQEGDRSGIVWLKSMRACGYTSRLFLIFAVRACLLYLIYGFFAALFKTEKIVSMKRRKASLLKSSGESQGRSARKNLNFPSMHSMTYFGPELPLYPSSRAMSLSFRSVPYRKPKTALSLAVRRLENFSPHILTRSRS